MILTGIDLIEIERLEGLIHRHGRRFLERVYTPGELTDAGDNLPSLSARFAAKEAVAKALGCGIGQVGWQEIEIRRGAQGQPLLSLHGAAATLAEQLGVKAWSISLSHTHEHAVAMAVGMS